jgi:hypothetical protein
VRYPILVVVASGVWLTACTRTESLAPKTAEAPSGFGEPQVVVESAPPAVERARPRLSQTVTLGQGNPVPYTPSAPPQQAAGGQNQNVVVNNNIVVQGGAPGYLGYGGGYRGFGGYGGPATFYNDGRSGGSRGTSAWSTTGWEGARRTAAPGQTPGVGGNWSPPPSYGPSQMK